VTEPTKVPTHVDVADEVGRTMAATLAQALAIVSAGLWLGFAVRWGVWGDHSDGRARTPESLWVLGFLALAFLASAMWLRWVSQPNTVRDG
jgi:hypothetical protein